MCPNFTRRLCRKKYKLIENYTPLLEKKMYTRRSPLFYTFNIRF